jgi:hypothetical protein
LRTRPGVTVLVDLRADAVGQLAVVARPIFARGGGIPLDHNGSTDSHETLVRSPNENDAREEA